MPPGHQADPGLTRPTRAGRSAKQSGHELAGEAANGPGRALAAGVRAGGIDVVLLDIAMPQRDGLDVLKQLKAEFPKLPVLMLSTYPDRQYAVRSLKLGAAGYLNKSADSEQMIEAIRRVAGGRPVHHAARGRAAGRRGGRRARSDDTPLHERLSHREYQVFRLLARAAAWARSPSSCAGRPTP